MSIENPSENKIEQEFDPINQEMLTHLNNLNKQFKEAEIKNWVVGGWAVEGLRNKLSRNHHDIDYLINDHDKSKLLEILKKNQFEIITGWYDDDKKLQEFPHKIIAKKGDIDIDFVFVHEDQDSNEANIQSYNDFHFPVEYLGDNEVFIKSKNQDYHFNISKPEFLVSIKANDNRENKKDFEELVKILGEEKVRDILEKYKYNYEDFLKKWRK